MRILLGVFTALTLLAFVVLYGLSDDTARFFAWTISPPITAAFLGGGFGAGCVLVALSLRAVDWSSVRGPLATIWVFTVLTLVASLLHLDRFHLQEPGGVPQFAGWFWLVVYVVVPLVMPPLLVPQERRWDGSPQRLVGVPTWLAWLLVCQGAVMFVVGAVMFVAPRTATTIWPWTLTPLSARMVSAWLVAFGVAAALAVRDGDLARLWVPALAYATFGVLQVVAVLRYADSLPWGEPGAWLYLAMAVAVALTGALGLILARRQVRSVEVSAGALQA